MPNYCFYEIRVKGSKQNVDNFKNIIKYKNEQEHFHRVFEFTEYSYEEMADGSYQLEGCGDCAWSVEHCFLNSNPSRPTLTNLQEVSKNHNLQIEIIGEELGCQFAEHYCYINGECFAYESREFYSIKTKDDPEEYVTVGGYELSI